MESETKRAGKSVRNLVLVAVSSRAVPIQPKKSAWLIEPTSQKVRAPRQNRRDLLFAPKCNQLHDYIQRARPACEPYLQRKPRYIRPDKIRREERSPSSPQNPSPFLPAFADDSYAIQTLTGVIALILIVVSIHHSGKEIFQIRGEARVDCPVVLEL